MSATDDMEVETGSAAASAIVYSVNNEEFFTKDRHQPSRQLLSEAEYRPPDQHVLIEIIDCATVTRDLDEVIDLKKHAPRNFRAFESDRIFMFSVDQVGFVWGAATIVETELRKIFGLPDDEIFILERKEEPDEPIADGSLIAFDPAGAERLRTEGRPKVKIKVNDKPVTLLFGFHSGSAIKAAAIEQGVEIEADFVLELVVPSGPDRIIGDSDLEFINGDECFDAVDNHEDS